MADQKPTNRERVKEIVDRIEQNIEELFQSEKYFDYLRTMSRFHSYSFNNTILIHIQRPNAATPIAGFQKWKQFGRHVKKGEKGLTIIAPTPLKKKIEEMKLDPDTNAPVLDQDGNVIIEEKTIEIPLFKPVKVFSADQTDGKPLPSLVTDLTGDVQQYEAFMEALMRTSPVPVAIKPIDKSMDGFFSQTTQSITVREGMSEIQTVCATVHEIAHAVLHNKEQDRLTSATGNTDKEPPQAKDKNTMEVEAESVSFAVCQYYGIDTSSNSIGYIAGWSKDRSLPELKASLETINKTVSGLISAIDKHFAEICKERGIDLTAQQPEQDTSAVSSDTPEQFAADLYDFMDQLHQEGVLEYPWISDPREQSIADLVAEMQSGYFDGVRDPLAYITTHTDFIKARTLTERMNILADKLENWEQVSIHYVADFFTCLNELHETGKIPNPFFHESRTETESIFLSYMKEGHFDGFRHVLDDTEEKVTSPVLSELGERLEKLNDKWDAALVFKIEPYFADGSSSDRNFIQAYTKQGNQLIPYTAVFAGTADECQRVLAGLEAGTITFRQMRQPGFEPPAAPEQKKGEDVVLPDTKLDEYPLPDTVFQAGELKRNYGYMEDDLLPLGRDRALEMLDQDFTIYVIVDGGSAEMLFDREDLEERSLDAMFAVSKEEWEVSPAFHQAIVERLDHQEKREQDFLNHSGDCFSIYQVKDGDEQIPLHYISMERLKEKGLSADRSNYDLVYTAPLPPAPNIDTALDDLWEKFNLHHPADYHRPSMSVSDIIAIKRDGVISCHYCDSIGFQQLTDFIKPENYLKNAEVTVEDDLSMIDGIINNGSKATVAELEQQARNGQPISLMDLTDAVHRERGEKKSVLAKLNDKPPKQKRKKSASKKSAERER